MVTASRPPPPKEKEFQYGKWKVGTKHLKLRNFLHLIHARRRKIRFLKLTLGVYQLHSRMGPCPEVVDPSKLDFMGFFLMNFGVFLFFFLFCEKERA